MRMLKTITALALGLGLLVSVSACGKRGTPITPSEAAAQNASQVSS